MSNVTSIGRNARRTPQDINAAEVPFAQALAIIDILQGAAASDSIEPPSNGESLAGTLAVVRDLLETAQRAIWPPRDETTADDEEAS